MICLSLTGIVALLLMTRWGIGTSPDSVHYIKAARDLLGAPGAEKVSLTQFAPLYSFLLAAGGIIGLDPIGWARWLHAGLFALNILAVGVIVRCSTKNLDWLWAVGSLLMLVSLPVLVVHATALTEPLFLLLTLLGLHVLSLYLDNSKLSFLLSAALALGLAFLTRYAGAACVLAGSVAILVLSSRPLGRRTRDTLLFACVSVAPMLAWMLRNLAVGSSATGRQFLFHPIEKSHVWQALYTVSSWMVIPASAPDAVRLALGCALAGGLSAVLLRRGPARSAPQVIRVLALFITVYGAFLVISISFFDANTPLDDRILLPVFAAGLIVILHLVDAVWPFAAKRPAVASLIVTVGAVVVAAHLVRGVGGIAASYANGWGFTSVAWQQSATLAQVKKMPKELLVYSNAPEIIYLHTGRTALPLPKRWLPMNRQSNPDFRAELMDTGRNLRNQGGVVVYFSKLMDQKSAPSVGEITNQLSLVVLANEADGSILGVTTSPRGVSP